jgi:hypothetical protein
VIDKAVEFVSWGLIPGSHSGSRAIGVDVVKQRPGSDTVFGCHQMSVEILGTIKVSIQGAHVPIDHIAGSVRRRIVKGFGKLRRSPTVLA